MKVYYTHFICCNIEHMTTGESLLLITTIGAIIYGLYLINKKQKWKLVLKIIGVIIFLSLIIAGGIYAYTYIKNMPTEADSLAGISLGMKEVDVTLLKGTPNDIDINDEGVKMITYQDYSGATEIFITIGQNDEVT